MKIEKCEKKLNNKFIFILNQKLKRQSFSWSDENRSRKNIILLKKSLFIIFFECTVTEDRHLYT